MSEREYPVPGFEGYFVKQDGTVVSYKRGRGGKHQKPYRSGTSKRLVVRLYPPQGHPKFGIGCPILLHKVVASAKYQRWPEEFEDIRHMDGNSDNNAMSNLQLGDHLNNIIDDIERGDRQTSLEQLDLAIARLMSIREKLE